jgi:phosphoribosylpyrophosphate synthetase
MIDIHLFSSAEISGFTDLPFDVLYVQPYLIQWIQDNIPGDPIFCEISHAPFKKKR